MHGLGWDIECVRDVFNARDANLILNISIPIFLSVWEGTPFDLNNVMGLGWVLRDDQRIFLAARNARVLGNYGVKEAEALSLRVREALSWIKEAGTGNVNVEMDSQIIFYAITSPSFYSAFGLLIDDLKDLAFVKGFENWPLQDRRSSLLSQVGKSGRTFLYFTL